MSLIITFMFEPAKLQMNWARASGRRKHRLAAPARSGIADRLPGDGFSVTWLEEYFAATLPGGRSGPRGYRQAYLAGWDQTYPGAGGFIDRPFRCDFDGLAPTKFCTERLEAQDRGCETAPGNRSVRRERRVDRGIGAELIEDAVWVSLMNPKVLVQRSGHCPSLP